MIVRLGKIEDIEGIKNLYKNAAYEGSGLPILKNEVTTEYVEGFVKKAIDSGIIVVAEVEGKIIGELHGCRENFHLFDHVINNINIAVLREYRGMGLGKSLFKYFFKKVNKKKDIMRLEVLVRESNPRAIYFYEKVGFIREGRLRGRIKNFKGELEADIMMGWVKVQ
ncbi:GNAT family N-acetyltransferase [uncultured Ilyobacter sp.]|uniref:GNAT family N-acetyltransferase n=1 Tax=uncultured Ilyobacter sp. TaxID=544433 RepID=UPI0029C007A2|nr:GNAT family N-acetyltransferase [uncultured Ilyobacter sp.]